MRYKALSLCLISTMIGCFALGCGKAGNEPMDTKAEVSTPSAGPAGNDSSELVDLGTKTKVASATENISTPKTDSANAAGSKELSAYADFLSNYMLHPAVSTQMAEDWEEEDVPADAESVYFTLIYVNDDDIPELAISNGECPWNPVHLFTYSDGKVSEEGEYSMYGIMYYAPKKGHILPMYYFPPAEAEVDIFGSDEKLTYDVGQDFNSYRPVADYDSVCLADVKDMEQELIRLKKAAPIGMTPLGAPIIDDSYLTEGEASFEGKHADEIPGIWYLETDDGIDITWIEFDTNGTFTAHTNDMPEMPVVGYIKYEEESPLLEDGGIYYLYYSDGTRYDAFEIGPVEKYGYIMNFFGRVYFKHPENWEK